MWPANVQSKPNYPNFSLKPRSAMYLSGMQAERDMFCAQIFKPCTCGTNMRDSLV